ncbi:MAG: phosphate-starvation-inducible PsiE family protein [Steroidobacteraceae bacterium]|jgi:uncharacterized membrane protein (DUF373 family)
MMKWIERFETWINWAVLLMMALVVLMLAIGFAIDLGRDILTYPTGTISNEQLYAIFGDLLLILIGLELMHTVKVYLKDHTVHVEVILAVALVALARKVIAVNLKDQVSTIGLALLIIALAGSHWLIRRSNGKPS